MSTPLISARSLCAGYGAKEIISGLNFSVQAGERVAVIGPNGCGKTTLLRALAGILPYRGSLLFTLTDPQSPQRGQILERRQLSARQGARETSLLSQLPSLFFSYSVRETVLTGRYARQKAFQFAAESAEDSAAVDSALQAVALTEQADKDMDTLSGGQLQRVFLARALAQDSATILLDEPSNHLDLQFQGELIAHLRAWTTQKTRACVGVFHDLALALEFADTVWLMNDGKLVRSLPAAELPDSPELTQIYGIDVAARMRSLLERWNTQKAP